MYRQLSPVLFVDVKKNKNKLKVVFTLKKNY